MRFRYSYAETMQVPHSAELAMRGCRPRANPHAPSSLHSCAATVLKLGAACPAVRSATCVRQQRMAYAHTDIVGVAHFVVDCLTFLG